MACCKRLVLLQLIIGVFAVVLCSFVDELLHFEDVEEKCYCENPFQRFLPKFVTDYVGTECVCQKETKSTKCLHGKFSNADQKCICNQCWFGKFCDNLKGDNKPWFQRKTLHLRVTENDLKESRVSTIPQFAENTCTSNACPCGKTVYKMEGRDKTFFIDEKTGVINTTARRLYLKRYRFNVYIFNEHDKQLPTKMKLVLAIDQGDESKKVLRRRRSPSISPPVPGPPGVKETETLLNHPLLIACTPYLKDTYYFNIGDEIVFRVRVTYNSTGYTEDLSTVQVLINSNWMTLSNPIQHTFEQGSMLPDGTGKFVINKLTAEGHSVYGNITGTVMSSVDPLSNLNILCDATADYTTYGVAVSQLSSPTVLVVFPEVNVTSVETGAVNVGTSIHVTMTLALPKLNFALYVELSTNIQDYIFMSISNLQVTQGSSITYEKPATPVEYSSQVNNEIDRVGINFGYVTVDDGGDTADRNIVISFTLNVNDHPYVQNNSVHWFGLGMKTGNSTFWVSQESITVIKNEPALQLEVTSSMDTHTHLYIGDSTTVTFKISHFMNTSNQDATKVYISLITEHFDVDESQDVFQRYNNSVIHIAKPEWPQTLPYPDGEVEGTIKLKVKDNILPFQRLPLKIQVTYKNLSNILKRPLVYELPAPLSGTPIMNFTLHQHQHSDVMPGDSRTFTLDISMTKMRSYLDVEIVLPVIGDIPVLRLIKTAIKTNGTNINPSIPFKEVKRNYLNSTSLLRQNDQASLNLSLVSLANPADVTPSQNQITIEFTACVNEHFNITNGSDIEIGAGVIGAPYMVWVAVINLKGVLPKDPRPMLNFTFQMFNNTKDIFQLAMAVEHDPRKSSQIAYNVTFDFYLTPYVKFHALEEVSENLVQQKIKTQFKADVMYCLEEVNAKISLKLDRTKCPKEGVFNFSIPVHLTYYNKMGKKFSYFKLLSRRMKANPRFVTIPKHPKRVTEYYGRGIHARKNNDNKTDLYLCMNQHATSEKSACYHSGDLGVKWASMDNRFGCILGHNDQNQMIGVSRNQRHFVHNRNGVYVAFIRGEQTLPPSSGYVDLEDALYVDLNDDETTVDANHILTIDNEEFTGAGDGIYHRTKPSKEWILRAKWSK